MGGNTLMVGVFVLISTAVSMGAGFFMSKGDFSWTWALVAINFFIVCFGILLPFRYHYVRSRRYRGYY